MNKIETDVIDSTTFGFNRRTFVEDILNEDFNGSLADCARALGIGKGYLCRLIHSSENNAGRKTITKLWRYAKKTGKDPEKYIFIQENNWRKEEGD